MQFEYSPYIPPLAAAALVSAIVSVYAWMNRSARGAKALSFLALLIAIWSGGYALEIAGADLSTKYFWGVIQYFGIAFVPYAWLVFAVMYSDITKAIPRRFFLAGLVPIVTVLLALTTKWHGLVWSEYRIVREGNFSALGVSYGAWFWVHFAFSYIVLLIGTLLLARTLWRNRQGLYRGQGIALLIAVLAPWVGNFLYLTGNSPIPHLDLTPFAFTITASALAWAVFGFRLVNVLPLARDFVLEGLRDGMIVLDGRNRIVDINGAAARMIGVPASDAVGKAAGEALAPWPHLIERFSETFEASVEISVGAGEAQRRYEIRFSPLLDRQEQVVGRVLMLRALGGESLPSPRFAAEATAPLRRAQPEVQEDAEKEGAPGGQERTSLYRQVVGFFNPPSKTDLVIPPNVSPNWYQALERIFTVILRIIALLGTIAWTLAAPTLLAATGALFIYLAIIACFWALGLARALNFRVRVILFLFLAYGLSLSEIIGYGFSVDSFVFFMGFVVGAALFTGRRGAWVAWFASVGTLGFFGWLIGGGYYVPLAVPSVFPSQPTLQLAFVNVVVFGAGSAGVGVSITLLWESLNRAWILETQASNLLQQERDLLEQRVDERTRDLAAAEAKYRMLVEQLPIVVYQDTADDAGTSIYVSPQVEGLLGYSQEEWAQDPHLWQKILHPEDRERAMATIGQTIKQGHTSAEYRMLTKERGVVWVRDDAALVRDEAGQPQFVQGTLLNITQRKQAEEQLRKLWQAVEQSPDSIVITDTGGNIEYVNPQFVKVTGYTSEEAIGKNPRILKSGEQQPEFYEKLWKTITAGQVWRGVFRNKRKDGSLYWESASIAPVLNQNGAVVNYVAIKEDITRQKEMEDALHNAYQTQSVLNSLLSMSLENLTLNEMLDCALDAILTIPWLPTQPKGGIFLVEEDQPGVLVLKSQRNLGAPLLTLCGRVPFGRCLCGRAAASKHIEHADCLDERHEHRYDGIQPHGHYNVPILFRDEVLGVLVLYLNEGRARDPREIAFLEAVANTLAAMIRDKRAEEALAQARDEALEASAFKSQLLSRVSHELRTPLSGVLGYAELMQVDAFGKLNEKQREAAAHIIDSAHYLNQMVNDLLNEAEIAARSIALDNAWFSPAELLEKSSVNLSVLAGNKGLSFAAELSPDLPSELFGDFRRLQQVILNLAGNAIKFTTNGEVRVRLARPAPAQWAIVVSDTGAGIPKEAQEYIFEPFRQVDNRITRENRGSGLGLSITKQLVELMGGQITLESEVGKGSTFTVILPILDSTEEPAMSKPYALVIEDDPVLSRVYTLALQEAGFDAALDVNGDQYSALIAATPPDLVILDLHLPYASGADILNNIRDKCPTTTIAVVTADFIKAKSLPDKADHILIKPVSVERLKKIAEETRGGSE